MTIVQYIPLAAIYMCLALGVPHSLKAGDLTEGEETRQIIQDLFNKTQKEAAAMKGASGDFEALLQGLKVRDPIALNQEDIDRVLNPETEIESASGQGNPSKVEEDYVYQGTDFNDDQKPAGGPQAISSDLDEWNLSRTDEGMPVVISRNDPTSAVEIMEGMVLGHLGRIRTIRERDGRLEILFTNGSRLAEE